MNLLAQLDGLPVPAGADASSFGELKAALRAQLASGAQKYTARAPGGANNVIRDLVTGQTDLLEPTIEWTYRNAGDYDLNGEVNIADLSPLGAHLGKTPASPDWTATAQFSDGDRNGEVNIADISPLGANLLSQVGSYNIEGSASADGPWIPIDSVVFDSGVKLLGNMRAYKYPTTGSSFAFFRVIPVD
ncbi:MAG: hypothetical protein M3R04_10595, partial [bacterium]|nr:hypothetical protein [bacterium]